MFRSRAAIVFLAGVLSCNGSAGSGGAPPPRADEELDARVVSFADAVRAELDAGGTGEAARAHLAGLPDGERVDLARALASSEDPNLCFLAIAPLAESGHEQDAVPAIRTLLVSGSDLSPLMYYLVHLDDETIGIRLLLSSSRAFVEELDDYDAVVRARFEEFLVPPPDSFSVEAARERIAALERGLEGER